MPIHDGYYICRELRLKSNIPIIVVTSRDSDVDEPTGALGSKFARMLLKSIESLNKEMNATILMVTHDAFTASYCNRILFIKDGKIFNEIIKEGDSRKEFFNRIIEVVTLLGGNHNNVL